MLDFTLAVREAVVVFLRAQATLTALVPLGKIFGQAQTPDTPYPFVRFGTPTVTPDRASCMDGNLIDVDLHVFADGPSEDQACNIASALVNALDGQRIPLAGNDYMMATWTGGQTMPDAAEPQIWHALRRFEFMVVSGRDYAAPALATLAELNFQYGTYSINGVAKTLAQMLDGDPAYVIPGVGHKVETNGVSSLSTINGFTPALEAVLDWTINGGVTVAIDFNLAGGKPIIGVVSTDAGGTGEQSATAAFGNIGIYNAQDNYAVENIDVLPANQNGDHRLVVSLTPALQSYSLDGIAVRSEPSGFDPAALEWVLNHHMTGGTTQGSSVIRRIVFYPLQSAEQMRLLAAPDPQPEYGPQPTVLLDFRKSLYMVNAEPKTVQDVVETDLNWCSFDYANVIPGRGFLNSGSNADVIDGPVTKPDTFAAIGKTFVATYTYKMERTADMAAVMFFELNLVELPGYSQGLGLYTGKAYLANAGLYDFMGGALSYDAGSEPGWHRVAVRVSEDEAAICVDGGIVRSIELTPMPGVNKIAFSLTNNSVTPGADVLLERIVFYALEDFDAADLVALSTL